jgi:hypothetical protein
MMLVCGLLLFFIEDPYQERYTAKSVMQVRLFSDLQYNCSHKHEKSQ